MGKKPFTIYIKPAVILSFMVAMLLVRPSGMGSLLSAFNTPIKYLQILSVFILLFFVLMQKRKLNLALILVVSYYVLVYGVSYIIRHTDPLFAEACSCIALSMYSYLMFEKNENDLIEGYSKYYLVIIVIQTVMTITGTGLYENAATGLFLNRNHMIRFFLPGMCFTLIDSNNRKKSMLSVSSIFYSICFTFLILFGQSGTGKMTYIAFIILLIIFANRPIPRFLDVFHCAIYSMIVFVLIHYYHIQYYLDFIIIHFLHKDLTFTRRIYIWARAIELIRKHPLFGIGAYSSYSQFLSGNMHSHQYWLQLLLSGGFLGAALIILLYYIASNNLNKNNVLFGANIISITIMAYLVCGIDEALTHSEMLLPLLVIATMYGNSNEYFTATIKRKTNSLVRLFEKKRAVE